MFAQSLRLFAPFADLNWLELNLVAQHTQLLNVPGKRRLLRDGRKLSGSYYLLRGSVRCDGRRVRQSSATARAKALYPGANTIVTLTPVQLLHVDTRPIAFLLGVSDDSGYAAAQAEGWESRFLSSLVMQRLAPERWQVLLNTMLRRQVRRGEAVLREGARGEEFLVLCEGRAMVHVGDRVLSHLTPGDFFGEDALIAGGRRNATVTMLQDGVVMVLPKSQFTRLLLNSVVRTVRVVARPDAHVLALGTPVPAGATRIPLEGLREMAAQLDRSRSYQLVGGLQEERFLAAFVLTQLGFDAQVLTS